MRTWVLNKGSLNLKCVAVFEVDEASPLELPRPLVAQHAHRDEAVARKPLPPLEMPAVAVRGVGGHFDALLADDEACHFAMRLWTSCRRSRASGFGDRGAGSWV